MVMGMKSIFFKKIRFFSTSRAFKILTFLNTIYLNFLRFVINVFLLLRTFQVMVDSHSTANTTLILVRKNRLKLAS